MTSRSFNPSDLILALSLAIDVQCSGNLYHGWRVALSAHAMTVDMPPRQRSDVFYAALLHDVGAVDAAQHITRCTQLAKPLVDAQIRAHPGRGASVLRSLPGLSSAAELVACHHEWWNGEGYPKGLKGDNIPQGSQFIRIADSADIGKCFDAESGLRESLSRMHPRTGQEWSRDIWAAFLRTFSSGSLPKGIMSADCLYKLVCDAAKELPPAPEWENADALDTIFAGFGRVVDSKHITNTGHSERVVNWAVTIGQAMGLSEGDIQLLRWAGYVHDAGRIAVPKSILDKKDRLTRDEIEVVRLHAALTGEIFDIFTDCPVLLEVGNIASHHHERYDGQGYPDGLAGEAIPKLSRILAVADAYDAMTSIRSHRPAMMPGVAIKRLQMNIGTQFDPDVVDAIFDLYNRNQSRFLAAT